MTARKELLKAEKNKRLMQNIFSKLSEGNLGPLFGLWPMMSSPYCVIAKHRAKPGLADAYEKRMLADLESTRAEPGAFQFHIHRDRFDRDLFVIYEVWRDMKTLQQHFEEPYVKQFVADSVQYIEGNMEVQWLVMASKYVPGERSKP